MAKGRKKSRAELERNKEYQREYYEQNKEELLEKKKDRYRNDPEYREAMRIRDRRRYWFGKRQKKRGEELPPLDFRELEPVGVIEFEVKNPNDARNGQVVEVPVYDTPAIARIINRNSEGVRRWLSRDVLPEPYWRGDDLDQSIGKGRNPRLWTEDEVWILFDHREQLQRPSHSLKDSLFSVTVKAEYGELVQGIEPNGKKKVADPYA